MKSKLKAYTGMYITGSVKTQHNCANLDLEHKM